MVCIDCNFHGKKAHLLEKGTKKEYVFITPKSQVFQETCLSCTDSECPYNFNMPKLIKNKKLRKKVLDYVFDASFDDMLLEQGILPSRQVPILYELEDDAEIYSKPCYSKKDGKKLLELNKLSIVAREQYFLAEDIYHTSLKLMTPASKRIIIKRKDKKRYMKETHGKKI